MTSFLHATDALKKQLSPQEQVVLARFPSLFDVLLFFPLRYEDETEIHPLCSAPTQRPILIEGEITHVDVKRRNGLLQIKLEVTDGTDRLLIHYFNYRSHSFVVGEKKRFIGKIEQDLLHKSMINPRTLSLNTILPNYYTPIYPKLSNWRQASIRRFMEKILDYALPLLESYTLPTFILQAYPDWPSFVHSLTILHRPPKQTDLKQLEEKTHIVWEKLKLDELIAQQISLQNARLKRQKIQTTALPYGGQYGVALLKQLDFELTTGQKNALDEISRDLGRSYPMQRLLQGDVGSGKTIVATLAALQVIEQGYQVAFMAPTEVLVEQHFQKLSQWLTPLNIRLGYLTGSLTAAKKRAVLAQLAQHEIQLLIGTHAIFQENVQFDRLALIIIDEQHRFGVMQRFALKTKGVNPHQLLMSATPIPRTLAMSYLADLDVSVIDELPPGRQPIQTKLFKLDKRPQIFSYLERACQEGKQAYWVCPLVDESEKLQLQSAIQTAQILQESLPHLRIGLVHGQLSSSEKNEMLLAFSQHQLDILVATIVIEVGIDVPNASIMVIEHAERMGLAQLHQLRGRVGRGTQESFCFLLYDGQSLSAIAKERLKLMRETQDGFVIAQTDLALRGAGEVLGVKQSGAILLRFANLNEDEILLEQAQKFACEWLTHDPKTAFQHVGLWFAHQVDLIHV